MKFSDFSITVQFFLNQNGKKYKVCLYLFMTSYTEPDVAPMGFRYLIGYLIVW